MKKLKIVNQIGKVTGFALTILLATIFSNNSHAATAMNDLDDFSEFRFHKRTSWSAEKIKNRLAASKRKNGNTKDKEDLKKERQRIAAQEEKERKEEERKEREEEERKEEERKKRIEQEDEARKEEEKAWKKRIEQEDEARKEEEKARKKKIKLEDEARKKKIKLEDEARKKKIEQEDTQRRMNAQNESVDVVTIGNENENEEEVEDEHRVTAHISLADKEQTPQKPSVSGRDDSENADLPVENEQLQHKASTSPRSCVSEWQNSTSSNPLVVSEQSHENQTNNNEIVVDTGSSSSKVNEIEKSNLSPYMEMEDKKLIHDIMIHQVGERGMWHVDELAYSKRLTEAFIDRYNRLPNKDQLTQPTVISNVSISPADFFHDYPVVRGTSIDGRAMLSMSFKAFNMKSTIIQRILWGDSGEACYTAPFQLTITQDSDIDSRWLVGINTAGENAVAMIESCLNKGESPMFNNNTTLNSKLIEFILLMISEGEVRHDGIKLKLDNTAGAKKFKNLKEYMLNHRENNADDDKTISNINFDITM